LTYAIILCYKQFYHNSADFATFVVISACAAVRQQWEANPDLAELDSASSVMPSRSGPGVQLRDIKRGAWQQADGFATQALI